jgi:hypothetical protein
MSSDSIWIKKELLVSLPEGFVETYLGNPRCSIVQYRHPSGVHVREYSGHYEVHLDRVDPRRDSLGHLLLDVLAPMVLRISVSLLLVSLVRMALPFVGSPSPKSRPYIRNRE